MRDRQPSVPTAVRLSIKAGRGARSRLETSDRTLPTSILVDVLRWASDASDVGSLAFLLGLLWRCTGGASSLENRVATAQGQFSYQRRYADAGV